MCDINVATNIKVDTVKWRHSLVVTAAVLLAGCSVSKPPNTVPFNVAMLPADCRNRQIMLDWLESQSRIPQHRSETAQDFERTRNEIRKKIWDIRYHCQPV